MARNHNQVAGRDVDASSHYRRRRPMLTLGLLLLAILPLPLGFFGQIWYSSGISNDFLLLAVVEIFGGLLLSQWAVLAVLATWNWRPLRQRIPLFGAAFVVVGAAHLGLFAVLDIRRLDDFLEMTIVSCLPIYLSSVAASAFMMRLLRRWTLAPPSVAVEPKPVSVSSLLAFTTLWAAALAWTKWVGLLEATSDLWIGVLLIVLPSIFVGVILSAMLAAAMSSDGKSCIWRLGGVALLAFPGLPVLVAASVSVCDLTIDTDYGSAVVFETAAFAVGVAAAMLITGGASFLWLRMMGYRLVGRS